MMRSSAALLVVALGACASSRAPAHEVAVPLPPVSASSSADAVTPIAPRARADRDGDGVPDDVDKCPDEPETLNGYQDEDGCPDHLP
jgi:hypothetical protein